MIKSFLKDEIVINGKAYTRDDIEIIKKDLPGKSDKNPFVPNMCSYALSQRYSLGAKDCEDVSIVVEYDAKTNKIMDFIVTGICIPPFLASLSRKWKGETFNSPVGSMVEFLIPEDKKIVVSDNGQVVFLWL